MEYKTDEYGKNILLKDEKYQVMMEWEKPYMEACVDALKPSGDVLEIGFGLGCSAERFQKYDISSHTIIECDPEVITKAKIWAKNYSNVNIIEGMWQDEIQKLGSFNTIFFDDYFPFSEEEVTQIKGGIKELQSMTKQIQELLDEHKKIFQRIKLTDREIEEFHKHLSSRSDYTEQNVLNFANNLKDAESITEEQYQKMVSSFKVTQKGKEYNPLRGDRLVQFVDLCLEKHMKQDARISFYVDYQEYQKKRKDFRIYLEGKYNINYTEKVIPIKVPENCNYYTGNKAVIVVIEKND